MQGFLFSVLLIFNISKVRGGQWKNFYEAVAYKLQVSIVDTQSIHWADSFSTGRVLKGSRFHKTALELPLGFVCCHTSVPHIGQSFTCLSTSLGWHYYSAFFPFGPLLPPALLELRVWYSLIKSLILVTSIGLLFMAMSLWIHFTDSRRG